MTAAPLLEGLRIVEASAFVAAPLGGMTLAQLGAEVIRIDPVGGGIDFHRAPIGPDGTSLYWAGLNKNKRSVALDLKSEPGRELARALATAGGRDRGILLTNLPAVGWLDESALRERRPDLIMASLTGHHDGSTALDYTVNAAVGFPMLTGPEGQEGVINHVLPAWDIAAGLHLAIAILAAERFRGRTGEGRRVRVALSDVAYAAVSALGLLAEAELGTERSRGGNDIYGAFGRDFATADGRRVMVAGVTGRQWRSIVEATGAGAALSGLAASLGLDFERESDRYAARRAIAAILDPWFAARPIGAVTAILDDHGVCWGPFRSVVEMVREDPRCSTLNPLFARVDMPGIGALLTAGSPLHDNGRPAVTMGPAPRFGQDTAIVLQRDLGLSVAELEKFSAAGVVPPMKDLIL